MNKPEPKYEVFLSFAELAALDPKAGIYCRFSMDKDPQGSYLDEITIDTDASDSADTYEEIDRYADEKCAIERNVANVRHVEEGRRLPWREVMREQDWYRKAVEARDLKNEAAEVF